MKLNEKSFELIKQLQNGRKPIQRIAEDLSIAENTARSKVNRMQNEGVLKITGLVNPEKLPDHTMAVVAVKLKTMKGAKKAEEMSKLRGVVFVCAVTGRYDLIIVVMLNKDFGLVDFISGELDNIDDVLSAETFIVYRSYNLLVPYVL